MLKICSLLLVLLLFGCTKEATEPLSVSGLANVEFQIPDDSALSGLTIVVKLVTVEPEQVLLGPMLLDDIPAGFQADPGLQLRMEMAALMGTPNATPVMVPEDYDLASDFGGMSFAFGTKLCLQFNPAVAADTNDQGETVFNMRPVLCNNSGDVIESGNTIVNNDADVHIDHTLVLAHERPLRDAPDYNQSWGCYHGTQGASAPQATIEMIVDREGVAQLQISVRNEDGLDWSLRDKAITTPSYNPDVRVMLYPGTCEEEQWRDSPDSSLQLGLNRQWLQTGLKPNSIPQKVFSQHFQDVRDQLGQRNHALVIQPFRWRTASGGQSCDGDAKDPPGNMMWLCTDIPQVIFE